MAEIASEMGWVVDDDDPRAPTQEVWDRLTPEQRTAVLAMLPSEFPVSEAAPPEGDAHFEVKSTVRDVLRRYFRRGGSRIYVGCELPVYYPGERMFAPDIMVVTDVDPHPREHWTVSHEGKGLDLAMEILVHGRRAKDLRRNAVRYAALGIREYFVFDWGRRTLHARRLEAGAYVTVAARGGSYHSDVLDMELAVVGERVRFYRLGAEVPEADELIGRLEAVADELLARAEEQARRIEEESRRAEEESRRAEEESRRAEEESKRAESALAEAAQERAERQRLEALLAALQGKGGS
ncbi:MAG: hypothetical protein AMXMBFR64_48970 [Myxococcales bacterium]